MKPTTDDVLKWAREAKLGTALTHSQETEYRIYVEGSDWHDEISTVISLAYAAGAAAMQERCAKVCEEMQDAVDRHKWPNGYQCAKAIRALKDACGTNKTEHKWVCPKCKVDRLKDDCKGNRMHCPMVGEAYGAIRALGDDDE